MKSVLLQNLLCARTQLREPFVNHALSTLNREKNNNLRILAYAGEGKNHPKHEDHPKLYRLGSFHHVSLQKQTEKKIHSVSISYVFLERLYILGFCGCKGNRKNSDGRNFQTVARLRGPWRYLIINTQVR